MTSGSGVHGGYRPLIAVAAYHLADDRVARWPEGGYGVPAPYIEALRRADARTAIVSPGEPGEAEEILDPFDGLLLVGGGDVDPSRYGAEPDTAHDYGVEPDRDAFEASLLLAAAHMRVPALCICRGMQVMNVTYGGTLHQHLPDRPGLLQHGVPLESTETLHVVSPEPDSYLAAVTKTGDLTCSSHHHQGVDRVGNGLRVSGRSPDGLVEAIELVVDGPDPTNEPWIVGVQWHPEETAATDPAQQSLFDALALLARLRGSRAKPGDDEGRGRDYRIAEPDPAWAGRFETEATRIVAALPTDLVSRIDHVGSTAVPGLAAKPIVDIQLSLTAMAPRDAYVEPIRALGYRWVLDPWDVEHEYFSRDVDGERSFHLHVCAAGSTWERRHLVFRNWLRAHPGDAAAYAELKRGLAGAHPKDTLSYTEAKSTFITGIVGRGTAEAAETAGSAMSAMSARQGTGSGD
ncbi:MAG: gamma-glutamyl-gamma-aminobutyrate hydrolase family protein [Actinomycetota bacterium]